MSEHEGLVKRLRDKIERACSDIADTLPPAFDQPDDVKRRRMAMVQAHNLLQDMKSPLSDIEARALAAEKERDAYKGLHKAASDMRDDLMRRIDAFLAGRTETEDAVSSDLSNVRVTGLPFTAAPPDGGVLRDPGIHPYSPSAMHMGDCSICGNVADAPVHRPGGGR